MDPTRRHDGSDHAYRMTIEDRYKRLGGLRRRIRVSAIVQLVFICVRTLWHSVPFLTGEERLTQSTEYIFYAGAALFGLRAWAFGFGKAQRERLWAIMLYSIAGLALLAELVLVFYMYHVDAHMMGRAAQRQYPHMLAKRLGGSLAVARLSGPTLVFAGQWFERVLDVLGIATCAINAYVTKEYVMMKKQMAAKRE